MSDNNVYCSCITGRNDSESLHSRNLDGNWRWIAFQGESTVVDTQSLKTIRKCVRPISAQSNFESRRLWQNVTENLKKGDIDTATQHKRFVSA